MSFHDLLDRMFLLPFVNGLLLAALLPLLGAWIRLREEWLAALGLAQVAAAGVVVGAIFITYDVTFFKILYYPQTISTTLTNNVVTNQDVVLEKIPQFNLTVEVLDAATLNSVENATARLQHT